MNKKFKFLILNSFIIFISMNHTNNDLNNYVNKIKKTIENNLEQNPTMMGKFFEKSF